MIIHGRDIKLIIYKNQGNRDFTVSLDITPYIKKDGISNISKTIDQVFKIDQSTLTISCKNIGGALWSFIDTNLSITNALFPPWIYLSVDDTPYFLGLVNLESLTRDKKNESVTISAQDWSKQLSNIFLSGSDWERKLALVSNPVIANTLSCQSAQTMITNIDWGSPGQGSSFDMSKVPSRPASKIYFDNLSTNITADMKVKVLAVDAVKTYTVSNVKVVDLWLTDWKGLFLTAPIKQLEVTLEDGFKWPLALTPSFLRIPSSVEVQSSDTRLEEKTFEEILQDYNFNTGDIIHRVRIGFNGSGNNVTMMNRIQAGDRVGITLSDQSIQETEVIAIDYFTKEYILKDNLSGPTYKGANVYLNTDDIKTIYFKNAKELILKALGDVAVVNFDKLSKPTLSKYMFSSLGVPNTGLEPTVVTNINGKVINNSLTLKAMTNIGPSLPVGQWTLDTDDNWTLQSTANDITTLLSEDTVCWTDQLITAPTQFMTNANTTLNPYQRLSNRNYMDWKATVDNGNGNAIFGFDNTLISSYIYDHSVLRRWTFSNISSTLSYQTFNAGSYSGSTSYGNSGLSSGHYVFSIDLFPAINCALGTGKALISVDALGNLRTHGAVSDYTLFDARLAMGIIKNTPYGTYIITKTGYGKINWSGSALSVSFCKIATDDQINTLTLLPNMFAHLNSSTNYIMAIFTHKNNDDGTDISTSARLLELLATPDADPTITVKKDAIGRFGEEVFTFVSSMGRMVKDPFNNRILIIYDGRTYQIANKAGLIIERLKVDGMNALELIEYICQILGAMAIPNPKGYLEIVSVNYAPTPVNVSTGVIETTQSRLNKYFFSIVRVNGYKDEVFADAFGQEGTQSFEISQHPLLFTSSQCAAVADTLASFYGIPRREEKQAWKQISSLNTFDNLQLFSILTINSDSKLWYLTSLSIDIINHKANITLLEHI